MKAWLAYLLSVSLCVVAYEDVPQHNASCFDRKRRIYNHMLLRDGKGAINEAKQAIRIFPDSREIQSAYIQALCAGGDVGKAWQEWQSRPHFQNNRELLEQLAWSTLRQAKNSSQLYVRLHALVSAALTNDAKAVPLLLQELNSTNALLRFIAIRLACFLGDDPLKAQIRQMLQREKTWYVRLQVIEAIGALHMRELAPALKEIIANSKTSAEEKEVAMHSLISLSQKVDDEEWMSLVKSDRAGLRHLAVQLAIHFEMKEKIPMLISLLQDRSLDVRTSVLNAISLLRVQKVEEKSLVPFVERMLADPSPEIGLTAAYALLLLDQEKGERAFVPWLEGKDAKMRRLAAAALAASGNYGSSLSWKTMTASQDPYVRANLALGLIRQREHVEDAARVLGEFVMPSGSFQELLMWESGANPLFSALAPSKIPHSREIPNTPEFVDQEIHLELLNVLSIVQYPNTQQAVKMLLQTRFAQVAQGASLNLLQEGDEGALDAVRALLNDEDKQLRVQAALILALLARRQLPLMCYKKHMPKSIVRAKCTY